MGSLRANNTMGVLPDTKYFGLRMHRYSNAGNIFPETTGLRTRLSPRYVCDARPVMDPGSPTSGFLWSRWRGNAPSIPGACATRKLYVFGKRPMETTLSTPPVKTLSLAAAELPVANITGDYVTLPYTCSWHLKCRTYEIYWRELGIREPVYTHHRNHMSPRIAGYSVMGCTYWSCMVIKIRVTWYFRILALPERCFWC